jgi:hypothetical protein
MAIVWPHITPDERRQIDELNEGSKLVQTDVAHLDLDTWTSRVQGARF